jgi:restriction endonuclease Mrr
MHEFSSVAIQALKEALTHIYWRKKDLRSFVYHAIDNKPIVAAIDWTNNTKRESVSVMVDRMTQRLDIYENDLLKLFDATMHFDDFSHLEYWDEAERKIQRAKKAVEAVRQHSSGYFSLKEEKQRADERRKAHEALIRERLSREQKIGELRNDFYEIATEQNAQRRGYLFERFLNELFQLFDLEPKGSFKLTGEQIDGAFTFEHQDYLLEAKWQQGPTQAGDLYDFGGKISGKLKVALGLFISFNGFSSESLEVNSPVIKSMILMDGADLMAVLDQRIGLTEMLFRKRRHAVEKGEIFLPFSRF